MNGALAIFVKTPGCSPVKTRLAAELGTEVAESFHLMASRAVTEVAQAAGKHSALQCYYAVAEQEALDHAYWQALPCLWQGEGGLGERMAHIYQTLLHQHDFVMLVGADIPQMTASELQSAAAWLTDHEQARMAFGPSADGGFWLFGGNCAVPLKIWTEVTYSVSDTGVQFHNRIEKLGQVHRFATLIDVDEAEDLSALRQTLSACSEPLPAQLALSRYLQSISS
ncbi:TIGR04282 family arsenosugar biosynthesis glycosyltransferase [Methylomarinum sp. Ch1-1]|uniref:TIGR04282 family arsenosugar biosynthesis glycosyltransferase n=1 Tax=Methylomarinum roseum TaxID=3067653 RepID=A0AAU7NZT8_9GAMM|nr:TIGR04282 family arsenosugar biosynthesis glycosyltransferase [Methylomarinum sp. Ch1-1]MDP4521466.1 TIGR04282 family arsenosugar biosynthesis glycosyltransferase [Methylomarinum sp. Ch1-1]